MTLLRTYWFALLATAGIWTAVGLGVGWSGLLSVATLTVLEVTFSFDNAVVNAKLLKQLSPAWRAVFMTAGILVAVFAVRFAVPIVLVAITAGLGFGEVVDLAVHHPDIYHQHLVAASSLIDAFGYTFLAMIAVGFFFDAEKDVHWLAGLERRLARVGRLDNVAIFLMLIVTNIVVFTVHGSNSMRLSVLTASICGMALHVGLDVFASAFQDEPSTAIIDSDETPELVRQMFDAQNKQYTNNRVQPRLLTGVAAIVMLLRLELLDASFSFDGVIGAFAITGAIVLITAGLGVGASWVRSMTVHLVRVDALAKYRYLEHGAHYAIAALAVVMGLQLYGVELPEPVKGSLGLVFIALAVISSIIAQQRERRVTLPGFVGMVSTKDARPTV